MPINPNIALGVRPIEQPNMLGQMAQAMQIRQANQEFDDVNAMRSISAKYGGDISNPDFLKEVGMRSPKTAADLRAKALANDKTTGEIVKSRLETSRELLSNVRTPEEYLAWHQGNHKDPLLGPLLASKGITADTSMATIQESLKRPGGFEELLKKSAMGLEKFYQDQTSRRNTDVSSGASYGQLELAKAKDAREQQQQAEITALLRGGAAAPAPANVPMVSGGARGGTAPTGGGVSNALPVVVGAAPIAPATPPATNMLVPGAQAPAAPSNDPFVRIDAIDARIEKLRETGNPKAIPFIQELISQRTQLLASAKNQYGGALVDMAVPDPANPGKFITVKGRQNQYGVLEPVEMGGIPLSTNASAAGGTTISPTVARPAPSAPVWNEKTGVWMTPPTSENPKGTAVENPEIKKIVQTRAANETLKVAGYDPKTGTDEVSSLIKKSTSGLGENWANKVWSAISGTGSEGAEAIAKLETRANEMTLALAPNGSLGAGFSNEDRTFMLGKLGDVANPNKAMNVRLAAWEDVMERTARNAGVPYTKQSYGGSSSNKPAAPSTALPKGFKLD